MMHIKLMYRLVKGNKNAKNSMNGCIIGVCFYIYNLIEFIVYECIFHIKLMYRSVQGASSLPSDDWITIKSSW